MKQGKRAAPEKKEAEKKGGEKKPRLRLKKGWKIALIALGCLLVAAIIAAVVIYVKVLHPVYEEIYDDGGLQFETEQEQRDYWDEVDHRIVKGKDADVETQEEEIQETMEVEGIVVVETPPPVDPIPHDLEIMYDDNIVNILLIGTDERTEGFSTFARGDSCIIFSINKTTNQIKLVSLERGMGVPILAGQYKGQWDWLTHTFCYGGAELMMQEVQELFRIRIDRYVRVNFGSFRAGINAIGGVDIYLTQAEADYINGKATKEENKIYTEGYNHLYGWAALQYARCRGIDSDWMRIRRQRTVIQAALNKTSNLSARRLTKLLNKLSVIVRTNLTEGEIAELIAIAPRFQGTTMGQMTIPASGTYGGMRGMGGRTLYSVDFRANALILQEFLYG